MEKCFVKSRSVGTLHTIVPFFIYIPMPLFSLYVCTYYAATAVYYDLASTNETGFPLCPLVDRYEYICFREELF